MSAESHLLYEARVRPRQAVVAGVAGILLLIAAALQLAGPQAKVSELTVQLISLEKRFPLDVIGGVVQGIALLAVIWTLSFLFDAVRARRPEISPATRVAVIGGGLVSAIGGVIYAAVLATKAHQFVHQGAQTYEQAKHLTNGASLPVLQTLDIAAQFALQIGIALIALNAMRVGLLTRFMGYVGIVVGVAGMLLIGSPPAVAIEIFWLLALAALFLGRWSGGEPPSWRTGRAEPWPSPQEVREQRMKASGADGRAAGAPEREREPQAVGTTSGRGTRATTPKRKRKRRK